MKSKILIVDDERDLVDAYVRLLARSGHGALAAFDAAQAIGLIDSEQPDLVLTDLSLPGSSGLDVVRHARAKSAITPIIVMTGHNTAEVNQAALEAGADVSLLKPVAIGELTRVIADALTRYLAIRDSQ